MPATRKIIHIDMDAFYASVEQRDNPEYRGKPVVVGGSPYKRGVIAAASYEARKYGIHSAMPSRTAYQKCPHAIFLSPRFDVYRDVSKQIRAMFFDYTDLVEPLSLDEAFLDVTINSQGQRSAQLLARELKDRIMSETGLTASAGVSYCKFLAKIASALEKPDGLTVITPAKSETFIEKLPVQKFFGIGPATAQRMQKKDIRTGADLKRLSELELVRLFGKSGRFYYKIARGIDNRAVNPNWIRKSISVENTFEHDLTEVEAMRDRILKLAESLAQRMRKQQLSGRTITLKVKYADFKQITRSISLDAAINDAASIAQIAHRLLTGVQLEGSKVRLLGVGVSNFGDAQSSEQMTIDFSMSSHAAEPTIR